MKQSTPQVQIFYRYFLDAGGYPKDIRGFADGISKSLSIQVVCLPKKADGFESANNLYNIEQSGIFALIKKLLFNKTPDVHYVFEFSSFSSMVYILCCFFKQKTTILVPLGQLMPQSFSGIIKHNIPEQEKLRDRFFGFKSIVNRILKYAYFFSFGKLSIMMSSYIGSFSKNEFIEAQKITGRSSLSDAKHYPVYLHPYLEDIHKLNDDYRALKTAPPSCINDVINSPRKVILMWSRIEPINKGMIAAIKVLAKMKSEGRSIDNLLLVISGPDYFNMVGELRNLVRKYSLSDSVRIILPQESNGHGFGLFLRADWLALLSTWDGFPRTLRESIILRKQMIVTKQTNFEELINEFELGAVIDDTQDAGALEAIFEEIQSERLKYQSNFMAAEIKMKFGNVEALTSILER